MVLVAGSLECLDEVLFLEVTGILHDFRREPIGNIQAHINLDNITEHMVLLEFILVDELPIGHKGSGVDKCVENVVE